ncbi:MAG TPA: DUF3581 family protein [Chromatiaceae bacterium]|jgi:hypothetical protein|nr:DUF3581 family protein [Chromatiaceae bacterium]HIA07556.1 DUF3581 family protein [Chromatiaceae bacterium]HIO55385.1 DUF3581 family protein [Chromatiales bacterium]
MQLTDFYSQNDGKVGFTREQASTFARTIADDFNPIHDPGAKRFCVPGDLLFAVALSHYGLYQKMVFNFAGMVTDNVVLTLPSLTDGKAMIIGDNDKEYLNVRGEGERTDATDVIRDFTQRYVAFSGHTFTQVLVPLMRDNKVMINPDRPLVIYESMSVDLDHLDLHSPSLELSGSQLDVTGKRGNVTLKFRLMENAQEVGHGRKQMVLSGLREYDDATMRALVDLYDARKQENP